MEQALEKVFLPNVFQAEALRALEETTEKGGIVIMPTGTGKTFLASLWFKRILDLDPQAKLLFVCHNRDILSQANEKEFQGCLRHLDIDFGYYTAKIKEFKQCTFATTQTLTRSLKDFKEDYFDYIIVDEAHHYQAKSFKKVLEHFKPKFTLGLTATPHRMDNKDVFKVIGKKIYEAKTCDAIKKGLLCKINYWSTDNDMDFSGVAWSGSNYNEKDLNRTICVKEYDEVILKEYNETLREKFQKKKTICFCATVEHTHRMTELFNKNGIKAVGLTSKNKEGTKTLRRNERVSIINGFKDGKYDIVFVRDLFNEGIDIPSCDSIMMLRPTQSHTIFTQQIGRGLRTAEGKDDVLILDFTGNCRNCIINYEILGEMLECDVKEQVRKESERKEKREVVLLSNGCRIRLSRRKIDILRVRLDSLPMTLDMAIKKYNEIYEEEPRRGELRRRNKLIYNSFKRNNQLDKYCTDKGGYTILNEAIKQYEREHARKITRSQLQKQHNSIYQHFFKYNLLDKYCLPDSRNTLDREELIKKYHEKYKQKPTRAELQRNIKQFYQYLYINNLLDEYCLPSTRKRLDLRNSIEKYNKLYKQKPTRIELYNENQPIYQHFRKNNLLNKYTEKPKTISEKNLQKYYELYKTKPTAKELRLNNRKLYLSLKKYNNIEELVISEKEAISEQLKNFYKENGYVPTRTDFAKHLNLHYDSISYKFKTNKWKEAVREVFGKEMDIKYGPNTGRFQKGNNLSEDSREKISKSMKKKSEERLILIIKKYNEMYKTKPYRKQMDKDNPNMYRKFLRHNLLDKYCLPARSKRTKPTRTQLKREDERIYDKFRKHNLLDKYCLPSEKLNLNQTIKKYEEKYKTKPKRKQLCNDDKAIYEAFRLNNLLDKYCQPSRYLKDEDILKIYNEEYKTKPTRGQLHKEHNVIYKHFRVNNLLDKYCLPSKMKKQQQPNIKITPTYKPVTIIPKTKKRKSGTHAKYPESLVRKEYKSKEDKVDIREKILSNIQDGDKVLLLESPDLSAIKEIEKQNKKPSKIVIPNDKEFKKLAENIKNYKTDLNIEIINTSVLQYLVDTKEKFDFVWLDYCGAFSYYIEDLDVLFKKHFNDMKLILTYNLFDPAKDDDSYYFTRVIDYVLSKISETNKIRLINNITYRYKKTMYNIGFEIGDCHGKKS